MLKKTKTLKQKHSETIESLQTQINQLAMVLEHLIFPPPVRIKGPGLATAYAGDSGYDLTVTHVEKLPGAVDGLYLCYTGVYLEMPKFLEAQVRPRSSSAKKGHGVQFGTIDSNYRGEITVVVRALEMPVPGTKIAQLVFARVVHPIFETVEELNESVRGTKGFGSSDTVLEPSVDDGN